MTGHMSVSSSQTCNGIQATLATKFTALKPELSGEGTVTLHCPASDGSRQLGLDVTIDEWQIHPTVSVKDASLIATLVIGGTSESLDEGAMDFSLSGSVNGNSQSNPLSPSLNNQSPQQSMFQFKLARGFLFFQNQTRVPVRHQ